MEFGKVDLPDLEEIDYSLPADPDSTRLYLEENKGKYETKIYVGCSKWGQKEWTESIYPADAHENDFLKLYIENFDCIELDSTFYNIQRKNVHKIVEAVQGKQFKVCPKFSRRISHAKNINETGDITEYFVDLISQFGDNLGAAILQLPEYFAQKRMGELEEFLGKLPPGFPVNVELRNKGWFFEPNHPVFEMLKRNYAGAAITATPGRRDAIHMHITSTISIIRFVGNNLHPTDYVRMNLWAIRIREWARYNALKEIYFFVHHDDERYSPSTVAYMAKKLEETA